MQQAAVAFGFAPSFGPRASARSTGLVSGARCTLHGPLLGLLGAFLLGGVDLDPCLPHVHRSCLIYIYISTHVHARNPQPAL
jgi:hypothetical protein